MLNNSKMNIKYSDKVILKKINYFFLNELYTSMIERINEKWIMWINFNFFIYYIIWLYQISYYNVRAYLWSYKNICTYFIP